MSARRPPRAASSTSSARPVGRGACSEAALGATSKRRARPRRDARGPRRPRPGRASRHPRRLGRAGPSRRLQHRRPRPQAQAPRRTSPRDRRPRPASGARGVPDRGAPRGVAPVGTSHKRACATWPCGTARAPQRQVPKAHGLCLRASLPPLDITNIMSPPRGAPLVLGPLRRARRSRSKRRHAPPRGGRGRPTHPRVLRRWRTVPARSPPTAPRRGPRPVTSRAARCARRESARAAPGRGRRDHDPVVVVRDEVHDAVGFWSSSRIAVGARRLRGLTGPGPRPWRAATVGATGAEADKGGEGSAQRPMDVTAAGRVGWYR